MKDVKQYFTKEDRDRQFERVKKIQFDLDEPPGPFLPWGEVVWCLTIGCTLAGIGLITLILLGVV